jgi:hypothetical protein
MTVLTPGWLASDNTLAMVAQATGTGRAVIAEDVTTGDGHDLLAAKLVYLTGAGGDILDHKVFASPAATIHVGKDIALVGGADGTAQIYGFTQTFSQVPEPATMVLLCAGGVLALVGRARNAGRARRNVR